MRSASAASSRSCSRASRRPMASLPSWRSKRRARGRAWDLPASRSSSSIRTAGSGTHSSSVAASPRSNVRKRSEARLDPTRCRAAIAACHARARTPEETDWPQIAALYDALAQIAHSPVVELNRAVAYGMAFGPAAGLELADALVSEPALKSYHLLPSVRGDLLAKLGRSDEARSEFERAAALTRNARERELLLERAAACPRRK